MDDIKCDRMASPLIKTPVFHRGFFVAAPIVAAPIVAAPIGAAPILARQPPANFRPSPRSTGHPTASSARPAAPEHRPCQIESRTTRLLPSRRESLPIGSATDARNLRRCRTFPHILRRLVDLQRRQNGSQRRLARRCDAGFRQVQSLKVQ